MQRRVRVTLLAILVVLYGAAAAQAPLLAHTREWIASRAPSTDAQTDTHPSPAVHRLTAAALLAHARVTRRTRHN